MNQDNQNAGTHKPEGFKDTPIGKLPADWGVARLDEIAVPLTETAGREKYETVSISAGVGFVNQAEKFGKELSGKQYEKYVVLHKGDFSYNKGNSNRYPYGCIYRLNDRETAAVPNVFESFRIVKGCPEYYEHLFTSGFLNRQLYRLINHGVRDDGLLNLTSKDFYSCIVPVPPMYQQNKIVKLLSICDELIQQYQEKTKSYEDLKKACLNKMFPQEGCLIPEVRFPGFSGSWGQHKLSSIYSSIRNAYVGIATPYYVPDGHFYLESNNVKNGQINRTTEVFINDDFYYQQKDKWLRTNDMVMVQSGHVGHAAVIPESLDKTAAHALIMFTDQIKKTEPYFLNYQYQTGKSVKKISGITKGNTVKHILATDMQSFIVDVPSLDEQKILASFFQKLDNLITLHQHESTLLQEKKKALMISLLTRNMRSTI